MIETYVDQWMCLDNSVTPYWKLRRSAFKTLVLNAAQTGLTSCCQLSHFPLQRLSGSACLSDKTYLKHILLTYKGLRRAEGTGCNWCQRGAKRQWFIARQIWLARNCHNYLLPPRSHPDCALFHQANTHTCASVFFFLQVLFMFEWLGLCVFGLPCPLKRALINGCFINQEVLAGSKRLWGQGSAEVLNQFPNLPRLDIFCFLAARRFIIILPPRHNGRGMEGGLDVAVAEEDKKGTKEE